MDELPRWIGEVAAVAIVSGLVIILVEVVAIIVLGKNPLANLLDCVGRHRLESGVVFALLVLTIVFTYMYTRESHSMPSTIFVSEGATLQNLELGYYWVCMGEIVLTSDQTDAVIDSRDAYSRRNQNAVNTIGVIATIDLTGITNQPYPLAIALSTSRGAECHPATDASLATIQEDIEERVTEAGYPYLCGVPCAEYLPFMPDIWTLLPEPGSKEMSQYGRASTVVSGVG